MGLKVANWNIEELSGYKPITTSYTDFSIADAFGKEAIIDTKNRIFNNFKNDYKCLTELTMALNWKIFEHYQTNRPLAELYDSLWKEMDRYCMKHFDKEALEYYIRTTD